MSFKVLAVVAGLLGVVTLCGEALSIARALVERRALIDPLKKANNWQLRLLNNGIKVARSLGLNEKKKINAAL